MRKLLLTFFLSVVSISASAAPEPAPAPASSSLPNASPPLLFKVAPTAPPQASSSAIKAELKDGTHIEIMADGSVLIVNSDGSKTPAPDGVHTLKDGTTFEVKDGKQTGE